MIFALSKIKQFAVILPAVGLFLWLSGCQYTNRDIECDDDRCHLFWTFFLLKATDTWHYDDFFTPCTMPDPDYILNPKESVFYKLPESAARGYMNWAVSSIAVAGCSGQNWKLSVIPQTESAQGSLAIYNKSRNFTNGKCEFAVFQTTDSLNEAAIIEGSPGCIPGNENHAVFIEMSSSLDEDEFEIRFE